MIKDIVKDVMFLSQKAEKATEKDKYIANDLLDTLKAHNPKVVSSSLTPATKKHRNFNEFRCFYYVL